MTEPTSDLQYRVERPVTDPLELEADAPLTEDEAGYVEAARAASTYPASSSVSGASASSSSGSVTGRSTRYWRSLVGSVMIGRIGGARRDSGDHPVYRRRQLHPFSASGKSSVPADRGPFAPPARSGSTTGGSAGAIRIRTQTTGAVEDVVKQALQETIEQVTQQRVEQQRTAWERTVLIIAIVSFVWKYVGSSSVDLYPAQGSLDGHLPAGVAAGALLLGPLRSPALGLVPIRPQLVGVLPEADGQSRCIGRSEGGGFSDDRPTDGHPEYIGLQLHAQVVGGHSAVDF